MLAPHVGKRMTSSHQFSTIERPRRDIGVETWFVRLKSSRRFQKLAATRS